MELHITHDLLDKPVLDNERRNIGRVDGVILELRGDQAPRVLALEIGGRVWARRLGPRIGRWVERMGDRWPAVANGVTRIAMSDVQHVGVTVRVKCDGRTLPTLGWEHWLRRNVIGRIPGA